MDVFGACFFSLGFFFGWGQPVVGGVFFDPVSFFNAFFVDPQETKKHYIVRKRFGLVFWAGLLGCPWYLVNGCPNPYQGRLDTSRK